MRRVFCKSACTQEGRVSSSDTRPLSHPSHSRPATALVSGARVAALRGRRERAVAPPAYVAQGMASSFYAPLCRQSSSPSCLTYPALDERSFAPERYYCCPARGSERLTRSLAPVKSPKSESVWIPCSYLLFVLSLFDDTTTEHGKRRELSPPPPPKFPLSVRHTPALRQSLPRLSGWGAFRVQNPPKPFHSGLH